MPALPGFRPLLVLLASSCLCALPACDEDEPPLDGALLSDMSGAVDGAADLSTGDAGDSSPVVKPVVVSPTGHDRLLAVTFDAAGNAYATGYVTAGTDANTDFSTVVVKFDAAGAIDTTFGQGGYAIKNVASGKGGEVPRGIVVQSTGKIVVSMTLEHAGATDERDRDTALVRFNADGTVDTGFGTMGVVIHDLSDGEVITGGYVADGTYGLTKYAGNDDRMLMMSVQKRGPGGATDLDFVVLRVNADGTPDNSFNGTGKQTLNINDLGATPRSTSILYDGSILATGYLTDTTDSGIVKPVVWKLTSTGLTDNSFGGGDGYFFQKVQGHTTEVYSATVQGDKLVTIGYGKEAASDDLDWISLRLNTDGTLDDTYGTGGVVTYDFMGFNDNARHLIVLPGNKLMFIGGGRTSETNSDALVAVFGPDGALDTSFGSGGRRTYDLGGSADFFWAAALSPAGDRVAIVGAKQVTAGMGNDDGALLMLPASP